ncbi:Ditrans,polycis-undecaprenyl-diphosphate synthase ((2E,6E)-farnesyl-diphosphate specific) [Candidatus Pseudomonas adelgestsugas]|uniref:Ditrans,polycis-undecaprenyl-diphosphate synthase ((2E,6E)-farnesyl-diphosphate specific) n=1 Tax=Candidatus Pseudomonas adelgestsugas TaxID=1302376 RepID=A0ABX5R9W6_9PSED|nr:polyprenyl diphosphate synthase [Candidatus Pseudomonas adelgestsugas]QAX82086.1 Ditrans,polycis-undecaprenyl-diphosphate synthase ((2E,6E)-farnesyl-diphosphate specific) [Candidatus Pseudomonas adelgestsugas]
MTELYVVPRHVAIIMDGNNRWAKKRFMPVVSGHKAGFDAVRAVIEVCAKAKIEVLTLFAFSSENWQRPVAEVNALMDLFFKALRREAKHLQENNISLRIIGDRSRFHSKLQTAILEAESITAGSNCFVLQIAANYGGQWDITQAAQRLAREAHAGHLRPEDITSELLQSCLATCDLPLPDLCIRTGGEHRISNFLLWQLAYTELYFSDLFWPDFKHDAMHNALIEFASRQRRFGKTSEQIDAGAMA